MKKKTTHKQMAAIIKYNKDNTRRIAFTLNYNTEADLIEYLETIPNKNGYLKELIRQDMKKGSE